MQYDIPYKKHQLHLHKDNNRQITLEKKTTLKYKVSNLQGRSTVPGRSMHWLDGQCYDLQVVTVPIDLKHLLDEKR